MRHKKKNENTENRGFKYGKCKLNGSLPQSFHEEVRLSRSLWNKLVELHNEYAEARNVYCRDHSDLVVQLETEYEKNKKLYDMASTEFKQAKMKKQHVNELKAAKDTIEKRHKEIWKELKEEKEKTRNQYKYKEEVPFLKAARTLRKSFPCLHDLLVDSTINDFINTRGRLLKGTGGQPKFKNKFDDKISLKLRDKKGGKNINSIYKCRTFKTRFWMDVPDKKNRTTFYWRCGDSTDPRKYDTVSFNVTIHRPLPENAKIKSVCLKKDSNEWSLVFNIEELPVPKLPHGNKTVYFTPRWTMDNEFGDIFMGNLFIDNHGLLITKNVFLSDTVDLHKDKAKVAILDKIKFLENLNRKADGIIDDLKLELSKHVNSIKEFTGWDGNLVLCRSGGLKKLQNLLQKCMPHHPTNKTLKEGLKKYDRIMAEYAGGRKRLSRFRKDCYWNFGKKLAEISEKIYLDNVNFKTLGMKKDIEKLPGNVGSKIRKHKSYVAHYEFYDIIKKQCNKHGVDVVSIDFTKDENIQKTIGKFNELQDPVHRG